MSPRSCDVRARARRVRALVLDVDGVLTDGSLYYGTRGESLKRFSARDGFGIKAAQAQGLRVAVLSGRVAAPLAARLADLGIEPELVIQGSRDKAADLDRLAAILGLEPAEIAVVGDDIPDLPALRRAGLAACPADAAPEVRRVCHLVCRAPGGGGAVREVIEAILAAQGRWAAVLQAWGGGTPEAERPQVARRPRSTTARG